MGISLIAAISTLLIFAGVFIVHEIGHLLMARLLNVHVAELSLGFGKELWGRNDRHGTRWSIRSVPVCGMVHLNAKGRSIKNSFSSRPLGQRFFIVLAGPMMNMFFALAVFTGFYALVGRPSTLPIVTAVEVGSPADRAGVEIGDHIIFFDGRRITRYEDVAERLKRPHAGAIRAVLLRGEQDITVDIENEWVEYTDLSGFARAHGRIGIHALQRPLRINAITIYDEERAIKDEAQVRAYLKSHMGQDMLIGVMTVDGTITKLRIHPQERFNEDVVKGAGEAPYLYLGTYGNDVYITRNFSQAFLDGVKSFTRLFSGVLATAGNLTMVDYDRITPELVVVGGNLGFMTPVHVMLFMSALLSIGIGLVNLLPVPGLDGYLLLRYTLEAMWGRRGARKIHPYLWRAIILFFTLWVFMANIDDLRLFDLQSLNLQDLSLPKLLSAFSG